MRIFISSVALLLLSESAIAGPLDIVESLYTKGRAAAVQTAQAPPSSKSVSALKPKRKGHSPPTRKTVNRLIDWIAAKTSWTKKEPLPRIRLVPKAQLSEMYFGKKNDQSGFRIAALYEKATETIYLPDTWNVASIADRGALLHELIHHLQRLNKQEYTCPGLRDGHAYDLHFDWLKQKGIKDPQKLLKINDVTMMLLLQCPDPLLELYQ